MQRALIGCGLTVLMATPLRAAPNLVDNFDNGVGGDIVWTPWTGTPGDPTTPLGNNNLVQTSGSHDHTTGTGQSALAPQSDPANFTGYTSFGATPDKIVASAYLFEDHNNDGSNPSLPVTSMFSLYGASSNPGNFTDYIQLGVVSFYPSGNARYGFRTRYNDATGGGIIDTGVSRKAGWTKLGIEVDPLLGGGQVRFYLDDVLVGSSFRAGANGGAGGLSAVGLQYVRIGNNSKNYENFWYDDVSVTPEPAALSLLGLGAIFLRRRRSIA